MNIFDELKKSQNFVYSVKDENFIIGRELFLCCPSNVKKLYDDFIEKVENLKKEIEKVSPGKKIFNDCIESFTTLKKSVFEITYDKFNDDNNEKLYSFVSSLTVEEKGEIKQQRALYIFFLDLSFKVENKIDIFPSDLYKLKELI